MPHSQFRLFDAALPFIGRLLIAAIFLISGAAKIAMPAATIGAITSVGLPFPQLGLVIAAFVELAGGIALILGYRARLAAAMLAAYCIATAVLFHSNVADQNELFHFLKNIAMTGGLLQVVAFGAGRFGLDARAHRRDNAVSYGNFNAPTPGARLQDRSAQLSPLGLRVSNLLRRVFDILWAFLKGAKTQLLRRAVGPKRRQST